MSLLDDLGDLGAEDDATGPVPAVPASGMGAAVFLRLVRPSAGKPVYAASPYLNAKGTEIFHHYTADTPEAAARLLHKRSDEQKNCYVAVFSFGNFEQATGAYGPYEKANRQGENAVAARAWVVDLDVDHTGANPKKSPSPEAAIADLDALCERHGLPKFTLNGSGYGVHAWLVVDADVTPAEWLATAEQLAALAAHDGLCVDMQCTTDLARVLRVPGTLNFKDRDHPRPVVNLRHDGVWPKAEVRSLIRAAHDALPEDARARPATARAAGKGSQLAMAEGPAMEPPAVSALRRACPAYARVLATVKDQPEPEWRVLLCLTTYSVQGEAEAHKLSALHAEYDAAETQLKLDLLKPFGPFTCAGVEKIMGRDSPCATCQHRGGGTSPVAIARREARRTVTAEDGTTFKKAVITVEGGEIAAVADAAAAALVAAGVPVHQRSGRLVRPVMEEVPASRGRTTTVARLAEIKVPALVDLLARVADFQRWNARSGSHVRIDPPRAVAEILLAREGSWPFAPVIGVISAPTMRGDGTILQAPGYDAASRLFHLPAPGLALPAMAEAPTRADAQAALDLLNAILDGFPFVDALDRAVALSGLLTAVLRGGMATAPLHLVRAHTAGTGKSFLVDLAATIATGRPCPVSSVGAAPEELEKRLVALLLGGSSMVSLGNINGEVGGDVLCQVVERPLVSLRPLGVSEVREVECRAAVFATGNNTTVRGDMFRRTVTCNLDARVERPELRRFGFDPLDRVLSDRGQYIAAALTIARFGRTAGDLAPTGALGSYEDWTSAVRVPLVALGMGDPAASMDAARAEDPELVAIRELFGHWEAAPDLVTGEFYRTSEVEAASQRHGGRLDVDSDFRAFLLRHLGTAGVVSPLRLGKFLRRIHGRVVDGYRLEMRPDAKHGHTFALVKLTGS